MDTLRVVLIVIGVLILAAIYLFTQRKQKNNGSTYSGPDEEPDHYISSQLDNREGLEADHLSQQLSQLSDVLATGRDARAQNAQKGSPAETPGQSPGLSPRSVPPAPSKQMRGAPSKRPGPSSRAAGTKPRQQDIFEPLAEDTHTKRSSGTTEVAGQLIVVNVVARQGERFPGTAIRQALQEADMVYGDMQIFHRMQPGTRRQSVFSMANMLEPGYFDIDQMDDFSTTGLTFFMQLPTPVDSVTAYEDLLNTAQQLATVLDGELYDERRSVLTQQAIEHTREQLREFNYKQLVARRRAEKE
ncbi:MAG TPA: cell division protein ZipA [Gammaproteobacteria bacterium]|nr:cell division protein ZipA [Gammaproteobacteria bacterium]